MSGTPAEIVAKSGARRAETLRLEHGAGVSRPDALRIVVESGGALDLQELHRGKGSCAVQLEVEVEVHSGARMRYVAVVDDEGAGRFEIKRRIRLAEGAKLDYVRIGCGAASDRESLRARIEGPRSRFRHGHLMMVEAGRSAELDLEIAHRARHAESESLCRCVLDAESRGRFAGRILVTREGQGTHAQLRNDNLLLHESARMETRPELEVYADEVQCAHGAATGALDESALFYLMTRGLSRERARAMLVRAFASRISADIHLPEAEEMAGAMLSRALNDVAPRRLAA